MRDLFRSSPSTSPRFALPVIAAFAAVYVIWGSTYLAIVFAIETMPPFLAIGSRFLVAGLILYGWMLLRGKGRLGLREAWNVALVGALTAGAGTGTVAWAEQHIASGLVALLVTVVPIWMVLLDWKWLDGGAPSRHVIIGLILGFLGIGFLVGPDLVVAGLDVDVIAALVVLAGSVSWSVGSLYGKRISMPGNAFTSSAIQMLGGGVALLIVGALMGELPAFSIAAITPASFAGWAYLIVFGSIVAFSAYVWLMANVSPKQVSSYAYVNPVVAVFLGWLLAGEHVDIRTIVAAAVLVSAVALVVRYGAEKSSEATVKTASSLGIETNHSALEPAPSELRTDGLVDAESPNGKARTSEPVAAECEAA